MNDLKNKDKKLVGGMIKMVESKAFQIKVLSRMLKSNGLEPDLVDLEALVDSSLSLTENARIIREEYGLVERSVETRSVAKLERFMMAIKHFDSLSDKRRLTDSRRQARKVFERSELSKKNYSRWEKNTNRYDIMGVDTKY